MHLRKRVCSAWKVSCNSSTEMPYKNVVTCVWMFSTDSQYFPSSYIFSWGKNSQGATTTMPPFNTAFIVTHFLVRSSQLSGPPVPLLHRFSSLRSFLFFRVKRETKEMHCESVENILTHIIN